MFYGLKAIERFGEADRTFNDAKRERERAKSQFIRWLKEQPIGKHPAIDHHIVNTEMRELSQAERDRLNRRTYSHFP
jgi:hypothetical protein